MGVDTFDTPVAGQSDGLEAVFLQNRNRLAQFLRRTGMGLDVDDILQDMWLKLRDTAVGPIDQPVSYLYRMAFNLVRDRHRQRARAGRREYEWNETTAPTIDGISDEPSPERRLIAWQALVSAEEQLRGLGEPAASIFWLHRVEGKTQRVIATELGLGQSTVEKHLSKAYRTLIALRTRLDEA